MLNSLFSGLFDSASIQVITVSNFLLCVGSALLLGLILAGAYVFKSRCSKGFVAALALLPAVVCVVIMMVNGNIGAGVAVAGAFSLVRFRSAPGTAKEILAIFLAMAVGLIVGMGYIGYAFLCTILFALISMLYDRLSFGSRKKDALYKSLSITIPEDLDYTGVFDGIFRDFASEYELVKVKTTNMGSLFRLTYHLTLKDPAREKELMDQLRCRNGNLEISVSRQELSNDVL